MLIFKVQIFFLLVYIRLTFTINTYFFDFPSPPVIKTPPLIRYPENFQPTLLLRLPVNLALKSTHEGVIH